MNQRLIKAVLAGMGCAGLLAGCATTVDWGGPLLHYRYHYDSRPIVYEPESTVTYSEHGVTYASPSVVYRPGSTAYIDDDD
jgi:hypothetical protein